MGITAGIGRVLGIASLDDRTIVSIDGPDGRRDLVVGCGPDDAAADAAAAGFRRLQWVRLHLEARPAHARLAGTTRQPHVRAISIPAALALAARGLPAFVAGEGDA